MRVMLSVGLLLLAGGCFKQRNLGVEEIPKLTKLEEVMDVQATVADPQFKKIGQGTFSDQDWAAFNDMGARLQATSTKVKEFSKGAEFNTLADQLVQQAKALADAAQAKDAAVADKTLAEMKATCRACHKKFR
jgi:cytochrome c556